MVPPAPDGEERLAWARTWTDAGRPLDLGPATRCPVVVEAEPGLALVVSGADDGHLRVHDLDSGVLVHGPLTGHEQRVVAITTAPLPDGRVVSVSADAAGSLLLHDLTEGRRITAGAAMTHPEVVSLSVIRLDGRTILVTAGRDEQVRIWDVEDGDLLRELPRACGDWSCPVVTAELPDGQALAVTDRPGAELWDLRTGEQVGDGLADVPGSFHALAVGRLTDGRVVVAGAWNDRVGIWDLARREPASRHVLWPGADRLAVVSAPGDSDLLLGTSGTALRGWDLDTGRLIGLPGGGHTERLSRVSAARLTDGRVVAVTGHLGEVRRWDLRGLWERDWRVEPQGRLRGVALAGGRDGPLVAVTAGEDSAVRVWDPVTGAQLGDPLLGHAEAVQDVATIPRPDGGAVAVTLSADRSVRVWDLEARTPFGSGRIGFDGDLRTVALATQADGHPVVLLPDQLKVECWGIAKRRQRGDFGLHRYWVANHRIQDALVTEWPAGRPVALVIEQQLDGRSGVLLWDVDVGVMLADPVPDLPPLIAAALTALPDGRIVAVLAPVEGPPLVLDVQTGEPITGLAGPEPCTALAVSTLPDGRVLLAAAGEGVVRVFDLPGGQELTRLAVDGEVHGLDLTAHDGELVLAAAGTGLGFRSWPLPGSMT